MGFGEKARIIYFQKRQNAAFKPQRAMTATFVRFEHGFYGDFGSFHNYCLLYNFSVRMSITMRHQHNVKARHTKYIFCLIVRTKNSASGILFRCRKPENPKSAPSIFWKCALKGSAGKSDPRGYFVLILAYFSLVASPPRICRCDLFTSSTCLHCSCSDGDSSLMRSLTSLCTVDFEISNAFAA